MSGVTDKLEHSAECRPLTGICSPSTCSKTHIHVAIRSKSAVAFATLHPFKTLRLAACSILEWIPLTNLLMLQ